MRAVEKSAAFIGAIICVVGAVVIAKNQIEPFQTYRAPLETLWPLPGLVLLDWLVLGLLGLVSVVLSNIRGASMWNKVTWVVCGALIPLMILSAFSIGPIVLWTVASFALAGALAWARQKPNVAADLLAFAFGALGNLILLLVFILSVRI